MIFRNGEKNIDLKIIPIWRVRWETSMCVKRSLMVTNTIPTLICGVGVGNSASSCAFLSYIHSQCIGVPRAPPFLHGTICTAKGFEYTPWAWNIFLQKSLIMALRRPRALQLLWKKAHYLVVLYNCGSMCDAKYNQHPGAPALTHRSFYTQTLLDTHPFTPQTFLHTDVAIHINAFTHERLDTNTFLHTDAFGQINAYTQRIFLTR